MTNEERIELFEKAQKEHLDKFGFDVEFRFNPEYFANPKEFLKLVRKAIKDNKPLGVDYTKEGIYI